LQVRSELLGEVVGRVQRRHERERALGRVALGLVVDVVAALLEIEQPG